MDENRPWGASEPRGHGDEGVPGEPHEPTGQHLEEPDGDPTWSPDGTKIAFQSNRIAPDGTSDYDIWRVRAADGANPVNLTDAPGNDTNPAWQPLP